MNKIERTGAILAETRSPTTIDAKVDRCIHDDTYYFAYRTAVAIHKIKSSHVYFIMQQAFGDISWEEVTEIIEPIAFGCKCAECQKIKDEILKRLS